VELGKQTYTNDEGMSHDVVDAKMISIGQEISLKYLNTQKM
jgi:hypothetical protein